VDFLEGDPDQPIITGRVYNAEQMPPWELPANMTQSGVLSRSSKGGVYSNANALRFEDKKGSEQVWLHAEKNQDIEVENDETHWVGHDRTKTIDRHETVHVKGNRTETVDLNETITVHQNRKERVDLDESISIGLNRTEDVGVNETIKIGANRTETVGINETITIGTNRSVSIGGNKTETIAMAKAETIGLAKALSIGLGYQTTVGAMMNTTVGGFQTEQIGVSKDVKVLGGDYSVSVPSASYTLNTGKTIDLTATDQITLTVGSSKLAMKADGTITLNGKDISLLATGEIYGEAKSDIQLKGKNIKNNS
jgi:type VI secretion system secreted protein VgrG